MARITYIRVSSVDQNTARQEEAFKNLSIDKYYKEKVSDKNIKNKPELNKMMDYVWEGNTVIVESISRFGRSLPDLISLIKQLDDKGVQFKSLKEGVIDTTTATGKLVFNIFGSLAEFERETIKERQAEGIAIAKANGKYKGRAKKQIDEAKFNSLMKRLEDGEIKKKYICKELNISMATLDWRMAEYLWKCSINQWTSKQKMLK